MRVAMIFAEVSIVDRIRDYEAAGVDEVCIVAATAGDPTGRSTLEALAPEPVDTRDPQPETSTVAVR